MTELKPPTTRERLDMMAEDFARVLAEDHPVVRKTRKDMKRDITKALSGIVGGGRSVRRVRSA